MHVGDIIGDSIGDTISVSVAALNKQHVTRGRTRPLAKSAGSLLDHMERPPAFRSDNRVAAGLESSAFCQWVVDLTYSIGKCAYVGIARISDAAQTPEPLAEVGRVGRSALDRREWWEQVQHALFTARGEQVAGAQHTEDPFIVELPPQRTRSGRPARNGGRSVCAVPIRVGGYLSAIFAVEAQGAASVLSNEVVTFVRAMASTAAKTFEAQLPKPAQHARGTKALRAALEEMDGALSWVSHELNSPLTVIRGSIQLVESMVERLAHLVTRSPGIEGMLASIQELLAQAQRHTVIEERLALDLVEATRIRSAKMTLCPKLYDLGQIVRESVGAQHVMSPPWRTIHLEMPNHGIPVYADPDRIAQVVSNFLGNAVKYSPDDKPVEVRIEVLKTNARVSVRDEGPGLEQSELKRVWQRFYRVGEAHGHSANGGGLGLGLYIGREIIRAHGGRVGVTSMPAHGATFWFTLPLASTR